MTKNAAYLDLEVELLSFINDDVSLDPAEEVTAGTDLLLTGLVDSLGVVQLVNWIEDRFSIEIEPADVVLENFQSVELMIAYLRRKMG